ncbi:MAG TPA: helix-turn-helix domain-containing protein, partial [Acidimicrobiales bacterium]|nr:helix-turn-helix domain-containing protein [Acidimicrobiales bacterium]
MIQQTTRGFDKRGLEAEQPKLKFGDDTDFAPLLSKPEELLRWMTPARTAELLGFTRNTIYQLIRKGEIPAIKI